MKRPELLAAVIAGVTLIGVIGCEKPVKPPEPEPMKPAWHASADRYAATAELAKRAAEFDTQVDALVGTKPAEHRRALVVLLENLPKLLQSANGGGEMSPEFATRIKVIDDARETISVQTVDRTRMQSVEDAALRSAQLALAEITRRYLFDETALPPLIDALSDKIDIASKSRGPNHESDAADAFVAMKPVVDQVSSDLTARFDPAHMPAMSMTPAKPMMPTPPATSMPATMP